MFDVQDLQTYEVRPETLNIFILIDPARSMKKDSANTAMVVVGLDYAMNKYVPGRVEPQDAATGALAAHERLVSEVAYIARRSSVRVGYERYGAIADLDYFEEPPVQ